MIGGAFLQVIGILYRFFFGILRLAGIAAKGIHDDGGLFLVVLLLHMITPGITLPPHAEKMIAFLRRKW